MQPDPRRRIFPAAALAPVVAAAFAVTAVASCSQALPPRTTPPAVVAASSSPSVAGSRAASAPGPAPGPAAVLTAGSTAATGSVLAGLPTGPPAVPAGVAAALAPDLDADALGGDPGVVVLDPRTGGLLAGADATVGAVPASTTKLLTATAVLDRWGAAHRFTTRVLDAGSRRTRAAGAAERLVLVGGGDPSLTAATGPLGVGAGDSATDPVADPARLAALVAQTVAAAKAAGHRSVTVAVADGLFGGPSTSPDWRSTYVAGGFVGPVDALSLDGGRVDPDTTTRVADPALTAGGAFAAGLEAAGLEVVGGVTREPRATGRQVAAVSSPRLVDLVRHMLLASDNDYAETLSRQVAAGSGQPADFTRSTSAVLARLQGLGIATAGVHLDDGSGLSRDDRIPPLVLARVIAADLRDPALAGVPRSLPVAGRSGTLADRFTGAAAIGRGRVLAKTGTLTGVDDLAGYVLSRSAGPLVVVVMADDTTSADAAESAIDLLVSRLVRCGCHR